MINPTPLRVRESGPQWPYSFQQLRQDEPQLSISNAPHAGEIASWRDLVPPIVIIVPEPTEPPNQEGSVAVEMPPKLTDGVWRQAWELQPIPPAPSRPNWSEFAVSLIFDADIQQWFNNLPQSLASGLNAGLQNASEGKPDLFLALWARLAPTIPGKVLRTLVVTAETCNLPAEFTKQLTPPVTDQHD